MPSNNRRPVMFSSLSTMLWGEEPETPTGAGGPLPRSESPAGEDWVLVGAGPGPAPGDLGALEPLQPSGSTPPSSAASEAGEGEAEPATTRVVNPRQPGPGARLEAVALAEAKGARSGQLAKQRNSGKTISSKALARANKSVLAQTGKRTSARHNNFAIKQPGARANSSKC